MENETLQGNSTSFSQPAAEGYEYKPLDHDSKQIRLLRFQGNQQSLEDGSILSFKVEVISLLDESIVPYYAISYAWGENPGSANIILDGSQVTVPDSSEQALRGVFYGYHLTNLDLACGIWIDAICIQQADLAEKSLQVAMMKPIYTGAQCVLVWLGFDDDGMTAAAIKTAHLLVEDYCKWIDKPAVLEANDKLPLTDQKKLPYWYESPPKACEWGAFMSVFRSRWFSRLWVLQEVVAAKTIKCFRGSYLMPWEDLELAFKWSSHRGYFPGEQGLFAPGGDTGFTSKDLPIMYHLGWIFLAQRRYLAEAEGLYLNTNFHVTNPWDRVYALLGLCDGPGTVEIPSRSLDHLTPDYQRPLKDLYAEVTFLSVMRGNSAGILSLALASYASPPDWPSWVPRYDRLERSDQVEYFTAVLGSSRSDKIDKFCSRTIDDHVLHVQGVTVSRIAYILSLSPLREMKDDGSSEQPLCPRLASLWFPQMSNQEQDFWSDVHGTLQKIATAMHAQEAATFEVWKKLWSFKDLATLILDVVENQPFTRDRKAEQDLIDAGAHEGQGSHFAGDLREVVKVCGPCSITLLENRSFAICTGDVSIGDEVCDLPGGQTLFVLRGEEKEHQRLHALAYVLGATRVS